MNLFVYIISDTEAVGISQLARNTMDKFNINYDQRSFTNIKGDTDLAIIFDQIKEDKGSKIVFNSLNNPTDSKTLNEFSKQLDMLVIDYTSYSISKISKFLGIDPDEQEVFDDIKTLHHFKRIDAVDFAIKYDDGKDFKGLEYCDICIIGVSRSSKTPLSVYLASIGYKVSNIPLLLDSKVPRELFEIDSRKIFGLTMDSKRLMEIRKARLNSINLSKSSRYSDLEYIKDELAYADDIMTDLDCKIIDVTNMSIEEISDYIISNIESINN